MRHVSRKAGRADGPGRTTTYLVEHYWPGVTAETFLIGGGAGADDGGGDGP